MNTFSYPTSATTGWRNRVALITLCSSVWGCAFHVQAQVVPLDTIASAVLGPQVEVVAEGLSNPWAVASLPEGRFLVSERPGRLRVIEANGKPLAPISGLPRITSGGQGGLLDVVLDAQFSSNRTLYFCFTEGDEHGRNSTALARAELSADLTRLENLRILFSQKPKVASQHHFGCRIVPQSDTLFLTLGERFSRAQDAQTLDNHHGKVIRIHTDGRVPKDNPFVQRAGALPEIWSYGHRNPQGAVWGADGHLWLHEHGPQGGDELNRILPGHHYGWPQVSFGRHYNGQAVGTGESARADITPPVHHWTPSIAPSGMAWVSSTHYPRAWQGRLLVGSLKFRYLALLEIKDGRVVSEQKLLTQLNQRVRDVRLAQDGWIYLLTDDSNQGQLLRLKP
jgi:glucose/arabinose dehydrogenase